MLKDHSYSLDLRVVAVDASANYGQVLMSAAGTFTCLESVNRNRHKIMDLAGVPMVHLLRQAHLQLTNRLAASCPYQTGIYSIIPLRYSMLCT